MSVEIPHIADNAKVAEIAAQAQVDPELLNGAKIDALHQESLTLDVHDVEDIDGSGLFALLRLGGQRVLKLYRSPKEKNGTSHDFYVIAASTFENREVGQDAQKLDFVPLEANNQIKVLGRTGFHPTRLGIREDDVQVSRQHIISAISSEGQLHLTDMSSNGSELITKPKNMDRSLQAIVDIPLRRQFGRVASDDHHHGR